MKKKLNKFGIGPGIAIVTLPFLFGTIWVSKNAASFSIPSLDQFWLTIMGYIFLIPGLILYFSSVIYLLKGIENTELITTGPYYLSQNPLYASIIFFIVPAIALFLNSWLILCTSLVAYIIFKRLIRSEYVEMESFFGSEYLKYRERTNELFPFPKNRVFRKQKVKHS